VIGWALPAIKAAFTAARPTNVCKAKQELGRKKGVPKQELGNEGGKIVSRPGCSYPKAF
jgi:hypothetical protein